jgi:hypothetical protein
LFTFRARAVPAGAKDKHGSPLTRLIADRNL